MTNENRSILVVDDSPTVRRLVELILTQHGFTVYTAEDGEEGLEVAFKTKPDAILVDFVMPRMNGHMFCKTLRETEGMEDTPIILISSKGEVVGQAFEEQFGVLHYFSKPFEPEDLLSKLDEVLGTGLSFPTVEAPPVIVPDTMSDVTAPAPDLIPLVQECIDKTMRSYFQKDFPLLMKNVLSDTLKETGLVKHDTLVMSGNISLIPLPDLLSFISNTNTTGRLSVFSQDVFGEIFLEGGQFVFATVSRKGVHHFLTDLICEEGKCDQVDLRAVIAEAQNSGEAIGQALVSKGMISEDELMRHLRAHAQDAFNDILEVQTGNFYLEQDSIPQNLQDISYRAPLLNVLMEGLRVLDERAYAVAEYADESIIFIRLITNEDALESIQLTDSELMVFSIADGATPLSAIINRCVLSAPEVKRICYNLNKIGLLKKKIGK